jgi:hypothetical protein
MNCYEKKDIKTIKIILIVKIVVQRKTFSKFYHIWSITVFCELTNRSIFVGLMNVVSVLLITVTKYMY